MPKTCYTERDIEDLAKRGVISLLEDDDVVLTDIARDKAMRLGIEIVHEIDKPSSAPERPYIAKITSPSAVQSGSDEGTRQPVGPERPYITKITSPVQPAPRMKLPKQVGLAAASCTITCALRWLPAWVMRSTRSYWIPSFGGCCRTWAQVRGAACYLGVCAAQQSAPSSTLI